MAGCTPAMTGHPFRRSGCCGRCCCKAFYTVRSERQLMEQLDYNLLFRWFVGLSIDDPVWDATVFCKNRDRLLDGDIAAKFFATVLNLPQVRGLLSSEHFSVDGTLIEAWASIKSFVPKDGDDPPSGKRSGRSQGRNAERDFHGEKRKNDTHSSTTDPDARLFRKGAGKEAKLCHMGHLMMENRNGLIVDARLTEANGTAERTTALDMIEDNARPGSTVGTDKNYRISMTKRKRIEEPFGWIKTVGGLRKPGIVAAAWSSGSSCSPPPPTISFAFRRCCQQRDESVWSAKHETKPQRNLRVRRRLPRIDWLIVTTHIRKIALRTHF
nr:IS5 family transposase [Bradyrhizobium diazoefficiens]